MRAPPRCWRGSRRAPTRGGIVGVNIGANKDSADRTADYVRLIEQVRAGRELRHASTSRRPTRRACANLQHASALDDLLARVVEARDRVAPRAGPTPVLLKIAPDLSLADLDDIVGVARARKVDGMIVGNTTIGAAAERCATRRRRRQAGGLSGRPLFRCRRGCWRKPMCGSKARSR